MKRVVIVISIAIAAAALWRFVRIMGGIKQSVAEVAKILTNPVEQSVKLAKMARDNTWFVLKRIYFMMFDIADILTTPRVWGEVIAAFKDFILARLANPFSLQSALESYEVMSERIYQARFGQPSANFNYKKR